MAVLNSINDLDLKMSCPIGFIYVQYSGQSDPTSLFGGTWQNISSSYAGRFFRAEGGSAAATGEPGDTTTTWVLHDNTIAQPTISQLARALRAAGEEQTKLWTVPYK